MKKTFALLAVASTLIIAQPALALSEEDLSLCSEISGLATSVMEARQAGVPMVNLMEAVELSTAQAMVRQAYGKPRYHGEEMQQRQVSDFRDQWYSICLSAREK